MKLYVNKDGNVVLQELFVGVLLETAEGNTMGICQRDFGYEITLIGPDDGGQAPTYYVDLQALTVEELGLKEPKP